MKKCTNPQLEQGGSIFELMQELWPICRSITGEGNRKTLETFKRIFPELNIIEVPSGTKCFDWEIPEEWNIESAFVRGPDGKIIVDFSDSNLHIVNYSIPVNKSLPLAKLQDHLHSLPDQPDAIPYVTSYYKKTWGFCLSHRKRLSLSDGLYNVEINSTLKKGNMTYGEILIKGELRKEIFISTYICHPSMANNELSGPCLAIFLAKYIAALSSRKYSYRIVFVPETIGAIYYLSKHLEYLKKHVVAGFVLTCLGDERAWSLMPSRDGNTYADEVAEYILNEKTSGFKKYKYTERGSDERQYCAPGVDLPVVSIMRSKYGTYPEYHTSLDNLSFVTKEGLGDSFSIYKSVVDLLEMNIVPKTNVICEPMMSKRGLRATTGKVGSSFKSKHLMDLLAYCDGRRNLLEIAKILETPFSEICESVKILLNLGLVECIHAQK